MTVLISFQSYLDEARKKKEKFIDILPIGELAYDDLHIKKRSSDTSIMYRYELEGKTVFMPILSFSKHDAGYDVPTKALEFIRKKIKTHKQLHDLFDVFFHHEKWVLSDRDGKKILKKFKDLGWLYTPVYRTKDDPSHLPYGKNFGKFGKPKNRS